MADSTDMGKIPEALPADASPASRKRRCAACGSEDFVKLGRKSESEIYIPPESEGSFVFTPPRIRVNLWVCLNCGFVGWFMKRDELNQLREHKFMPK